MSTFINEVITPEMQEIKTMIMQTYAKREKLKRDMEMWYQEHPREHFPKITELTLTDATLSKLDSFYKQLWDNSNSKSA